VNAPQGSEAWLLERCGRATASEFSSILAKSRTKGEPSKMRATYMRRVLAERLTGKPMETYHNGHMDRGTEQEPLARFAYEAESGNIVDTVGFIRHPTIMAGCSPDGLVGDDGGCEIKSVIPTVQVETLLRGYMPPEHKPQVYGNLWITGRAWWDFCSFSPDMPEHLQLSIHRIYPDPDYIAMLENEVRAFLTEVDKWEAYLMDRSTLLDKLVESVNLTSAGMQA
jgi:hypothetical protein